ncbi:ABC transporter [bacterium]|nr:ABC transporter ATP-binding protein [Chloroflexi bacterium CFX6]RIL09315.1 MAG: ABC transporter [bacterium]
MTPDLAIETRALRKVFGDVTAVQGLTLQVARGEVFGFLGPNGAGKTTSIKMLLGLIAPTAGEAWLLGRPLGDRGVRARVGFLPEHFRFHDWLTAGEFLDLHGELYGMPRDRRRTRIPELLELVGLTAFRAKALRTFSKGMLQRIGLAQALLNDPELVVLDEPTSGLDPVGRRLVRDIIRDLKARGTTVLLNSHLLSEVEITCDRAVFIKHGAVVQVSPLGTLIDGDTSVTIRTGPLPDGLAASLHRWARDVRVDGTELRLTVADETALPAITRHLVEHGVDVYAVRPHKLSLEDLFLQILGTEGSL